MFDNLCLIIYSLEQTESAGYKRSAQTIKFMNTAIKINNVCKCLF